MNKFLDILNAAYKFVETGADVSWVRRFTALGKAYLSGVESDITYVPNKKDLSEALQNKIMSAQRAAGKIRSKSTVISCGFGAMARPSVFFKALKFIAEKNKSPLRLTWVTVSAAGARGRAAGSLEDLAIPGLIERYITGHVETVKAFVPLVSGGQMAWDMLPQGVITQVLVAQAQNKNFVETETGLGTYVEKQIDDGATNLVTRSGDKLRYTLPRIGVAIVVAASVDNEGNISAEGAASLTEMADAARAAKANGGIVIAVVGKVVDSFTAERLLSSHEVDYIIVDPYAEQIGGIPLNDAWSLFLPRTQSVSAADFKEAYAALRLINKVAGITSERDASAQMVARLGARVLQENIKEGALVNLGVGLPEEVAGIYCDEGRSEEVLFTVEGGAMGGLPAPGVFFGASLYPQKLTSSTTTFARYREGLDATVLGFLQIDAEGNVNVSRRGADGSAKTAIGPGGFIDICEGAKLIIFMGSSRVRGKVEITPNGVKILPGGKPKLVPRLDEVTFSAKRALQKGKQVFYATDFGLLRLTENGLELIEVFRGIDIERDIERTQLIPIDVSRVKKRRIQI